MRTQWNDQGVLRHLFSSLTFITCDPPSALVISTDEIMSAMVWALPACGKSHPIINKWGKRHKECQLQGSPWRVCYRRAGESQALPHGGMTTSPQGWVKIKQKQLPKEAPWGQEGCTGNGQTESDLAPWCCGSTHRHGRQIRLSSNLR